MEGGGETWAKKSGEEEPAPKRLTVVLRKHVGGDGSSPGLVLNSPQSALHWGELFERARAGDPLTYSSLSRSAALVRQSTGESASSEPRAAKRQATPLLRWCLGCKYAPPEKGASNPAAGGSVYSASFRLHGALLLRVAVPDFPEMRKMKDEVAELQEEQRAWKLSAEEEAEQDRLSRQLESEERRVLHQHGLAFLDAWVYAGRRDSLTPLAYLFLTRHSKLLGGADFGCPLTSLSIHTEPLPDGVSLLFGVPRELERPSTWQKDGQTPLASPGFQETYFQGGLKRASWEEWPREEGVDLRVVAVSGKPRSREGEDSSEANFELLALRRSAGDAALHRFGPEVFARLNDSENRLLQKLQSDLARLAIDARNPDAKEEVKRRSMGDKEAFDKFVEEEYRRLNSTVSVESHGDGLHEEEASVRTSLADDKQNVSQTQGERKSEAEEASKAFLAKTGAAAEAPSNEEGTSSANSQDSSNSSNSLHPRLEVPQPSPKDSLSAADPSLAKKFPLLGNPDSQAPAEQPSWKKIGIELLDINKKGMPVPKGMESWTPEVLDAFPLRRPQNSRASLAAPGGAPLCSVHMCVCMQKRREFQEKAAASVASSVADMRSNKPILELTDIAQLLQKQLKCSDSEFQEVWKGGFDRCGSLLGSGDAQSEEAAKAGVPFLTGGVSLASQEGSFSLLQEVGRFIDKGFSAAPPEADASEESSELIHRIEKSLSPLGPDAVSVGKAAAADALSRGASEFEAEFAAQEKGMRHSAVVADSLARQEKTLARRLDPLAGPGPDLASPTQIGKPPVVEGELAATEVRGFSFTTEKAPPLALSPRLQKALRCLADDFAHRRIPYMTPEELENLRSKLEPQVCL